MSSEYKWLNNFINGKKVIIFSSSNGGQSVAEKIKNNFAYYIDNNKKKQGEIINGKEVKSPECLKDENYNNIIILIASIYKKEISIQLRKMGFKYYKHYINALDFIETNETESIWNKVKGYINQKPYLLDIYNTKSLFNEIQEKYIFKIKNNELIDQKIKSGIPVSLQRYEFKENPQILSKGFDLLIHGSQADGTATAFSDIDDLIILKKEFFTSFEVFEATIKELHRLNLFYQSKDITQHHGHWLVSFDELYHYNEVNIPSSIFNESVSIFGTSEISYFVDKNSIFSGRLLLLSENIENRVNDLVNNKSNLYELKHLLSGFALLFPLYYQSKGKNITKKNAIKWASTTFEKEILDILNWVSNLRMNWEKVPTYKVVEEYKNRFMFMKNREVIETAVSFNAPIITTMDLGIEDPHYFKDKINYCLDFFKMST
ncbi:hypothetical protein [Niallia sp. FSL W8-0954]|uniref:hypothetical protein n=1 Tax=Niallia sp. FSL W8-0954 TaxID=2975338 RepID=UPI0013D62183